MGLETGFDQILLDKIDQVQIALGADRRKSDQPFHEPHSGRYREVGSKKSQPNRRGALGEGAMHGYVVAVRYHAGKSIVILTALAAGSFRQKSPTAKSNKASGS
ncbi:hypothetical protein DUT91_03565 [Phyllobacterium salinisoli]|uniref:Uncharacterized protein n=1 Tax=Phyllobacterium salinisoli TaxID=1899321 RepID=A0A368K926_9HYPH|nr:hypothetical protein [Phyllobacterium salinisoli]RCS25849.1 hypothetical protein DUT91_03565 [Phyllobacterium salinisoli]